MDYFKIEEVEVYQVKYNCPKCHVISDIIVEFEETEVPVGTETGYQKVLVKNRVLYCPFCEARTLIDEWGNVGIRTEF